LNFNNDIKKSRILITGASGWIGQELLCMLQSKIGSLVDLDLTCTASSAKTFSIHGEIIDCIPLQEVKSSKGFDLIVHLAFLLPKASLGIQIQEYEAINRSILELVKDIFNDNPEALKLVLSTGAVENSNKVNHSELMKSYSLLKQDMETALSGSQSLIIRLWSATGHHIPLDSEYALANFISAARQSREIVIRNNVNRTFVSSQELLHTALEFLCQGGRGCINSGGSTLSLLELAEVIVETTQSQSKIRVENSTTSKNLNYVSPKSEFPENFLNRFSSIESQIERVVLGS
jgi:nucleoside-diphosphate-sugar epimerase